MGNFIYAAYGSNLHPMRLQAADRCPSARLLGTSRLPGWRLEFHKRGRDGSTKCNIVPTQVSGDQVYLAVYEVSDGEEAALDDVEGFGYGQSWIEIGLDGQRLTAKTYLAHAEVVVHEAPYTWYKEMVVLGARYHGFPQEYVDRIRSVISRTDPRPIAEEKWNEVERMRSATEGVVQSGFLQPGRDGNLTG